MEVQHSTAGAPPLKTTSSVGRIGCGWGFFSTAFILALAVAALLYPELRIRHDARLCRSQSVSLDLLWISFKGYETRWAAYPPEPNAAMVRALSASGRGEPYLDFDLLEISRDGELLDVWKHPLAYRLPEAAPGPAAHLNTPRPILYSFGPNGKDEQGAGDDLSLDR